MDAEIASMSKVAEALEGLDEAARKRVLQWAAAKYSVDVVLSAETTAANAENGGVHTGEKTDEGGSKIQYETFADLFAEATPSTHADKVLVAGYWHQEMKGQKELTSAKLNKDLANLGHRIINISEKFDSLMAAKPQLAIQLKKLGSTKQSRKRYKLTKAGIDKVKGMLK